MEDINNDERPPIILVHGGGNFGDIWDVERNFQARIVQDFPTYPIIFLPQSVHYSKHLVLKSTVELYRKHPNITIFTRDLKSLAFIRERFWDHKSFLCPDSAFLIGPLDKSKCEPQADIIIIRRMDLESVPKYGSFQDSIQFLKDNNISVISQDWPCGALNLPKFSINNAEIRTKRGMSCLCRGKVVVTDRLHAVIMATLLGLPHVHLDNSYGKISSYRSSHFQPRDECSNENLRAKRAFSWKQAMKDAIELLKHSN